MGASPALVDETFEFGSAEVHRRLNRGMDVPATVAVLLDDTDDAETFAVPMDSVSVDGTIQQIYEVPKRFFGLCLVYRDPHMRVL
jgi:hypothetical protein